MDNSTRSERTRQAGIQAALTIISRDGPKQLTFDAMARESRISKGGLMHQFPNKEAVLKALIDHQIDYFERFSKGFLAAAHQSAEQNLAAQLATWREAVTTPANITTAVLVAQLEDPSLLAGPLDSSKESARTIAAQATDRTCRCCAGPRPGGWCCRQCSDCAHSRTRNARACSIGCKTTVNGPRFRATLFGEGSKVKSHAAVGPTAQQDRFLMNRSRSGAVVL